MIEIRALRDEDHAAAAHIWFAGAMSGAGSGGASEADLQARIGRELGHGWSAWLAWRAEVAVGFLAMQIPARRLDELYVLPAAQRSGVGTALFAFACTAMPQGFWLRTAADDARAGAFYERQGCRRGEEQRHPTLGSMTVIYRRGAPPA